MMEAIELYLHQQDSICQLQGTAWAEKEGGPSNESCEIQDLLAKTAAVFQLRMT